MALIIILAGTSSLALKVQRVEASRTIYIRVNGLVEGSDKIVTLDNVTYTFTGNVYDEIVIERSNIVIDGKGYAAIGGGSGTGFNLTSIINVTIMKTSIRYFTYGVWLKYSSNNTLCRNNITDNSYYGISLGSSNSNIIGNNITDNSIGIVIVDSFNIMAGNNIADNSFDGIMLIASNNNITGNNITKNSRYGIWLWYGSDNIIEGNGIIANYDAGVRIDSSENKFYHNNFNNTRQLYDPAWENPSSFFPHLNVWDDGYPSGGNYWSDYLDRYPNATEIDASGMGDTAYVIDANNSDRYPLMTQYIVPEFPSFLILPLFIIATLIAVIVYRKREIKTRKPRRLDSCLFDSNMPQLRSQNAYHNSL
jgi:parallel beta-helix repeat protein